MFVADTLFCRHLCKLCAQSVMQETVTRVAKWSRHHKTSLNTGHCVVAFFKDDLHEARRQPAIHLKGHPLRFTPLPKFLGPHSTAHSPVGSILQK